MATKTPKAKNVLITIGLGTLVYLAVFVLFKFLTVASWDITLLNRVFGVLQVITILAWVWHIITSIRGKKNVVSLITSWRTGLRYTVIGLLVFLPLLALFSWPTAPQQAVPSSTQEVSVPESNTETYSFKDDVLTVSKLTIKITDTKVIAVGQPGNEYGTKPVLAFWYDITNNSDENVTPLDWITYFDAYQDNDPNQVNKLDIASTPDSSYLDVQSASIKKGGTISMAVGYELDDTTTPVQLVAREGIIGEALGTKTINLQN